VRAAILLDGITRAGARSRGEAREKATLSSSEAVWQAIKQGMDVMSAKFCELGDEVYVEEGGIKSAPDPKRKSDGSSNR
jgi:hypothetical protein